MLKEWRTRYFSATILLVARWVNQPHQARTHVLKGPIAIFRQKHTIRHLAECVNFATQAALTSSLVNSDAHCKIWRGPDINGDVEPIT